MEYVLFMLGGLVSITLLSITIQLMRLEQRARDFYRYTENKIKLFFENSSSS
ncbi:hypothetical protein [Chitinivibrio alkaliphilus]|uniref:Uncharacterized protein n=1 Tax=Chitinivibrio alkaliphilus ACht1 TaxID=1313304 RepID=U7DA79_9BACT|nr:hypothetical protein [Chitinivibrio alkaliphilus]ERP32032.1 hypothetical protein CALK_1013 [Chitinivibrio alkaliphilus ACht1]